MSNFWKGGKTMPIGYEWFGLVVLAVSAALIIIPLLINKTGKEKIGHADLEVCRRRVNDLADKLGVSWEEGEVGYCNEAEDQTGAGNMFGVMTIVKPLGDNRKMWLIFYPNYIYNVTILVYAIDESHGKIDTMKEIINGLYFYDDIGEPYDLDNDCYSAYVWGANFDYKTVKDDLARAAKINPLWSLLSEQF
jgi:hypothetical protein